jgi:DNA polymerase I-like protein with 3'-5' exonuclease and polymerase domains
MSKKTAKIVEESSQEIPTEGLALHVAHPNSAIYLTGKYLTVDLETTSLDYGDPRNTNNRLLLAVAKRWDGKRLVAWGSEFEQQELKRWIDEADFVVAQNTKFELGWFYRMGWDLTKILPYCTVIGKYVYDGNRHSKRDLNSLAKFYGVAGKHEHVASLIALGVDPSDIPPSWLEEYCIQDVEAEEQIFLRQRKQLGEMGLIPATYTRNIFTPVLVELEARGMQLDPERVRIIYNNYNKKYLDLQRQLNEYTEGINQDSPKQMAEFLYDRLGFSEPTDFRGNPIRTDSGRRTTNKDDLKLLKPRTKRQREFIELYLKYGEAKAKVTKYLQKFVDCCEQDGGWLQANFNQCVTKTHRTSSSGTKHKIQFQNMDRNLKPIFTTRKKGWKFGEADEAQLEFRVAVFLGNDRQGRKDVEAKADVHRFTASVLHDVPEEEVTADWRQDAKPDTFKPLYGGTSGTPQQQKYYKAFKEKYSDIAKVQEGWTHEVLKNKKLVMPHGFIFYWPFCKMTNRGYITETSKIYNAPVQHFATAEIVPIGVTYLWHRMKAAKTESFLVNTVHDSANAEICPGEEQIFTELSQQAMSNDVVWYLKTVYNIDFDVQLDAEVSIGTHWNEKGDWQKKWLITNEERA